MNRYANSGVYKIAKTVYLTPEQSLKADKIREQIKKKSGMNVPFSAMVVKLIEEKKV